MSVNKLRRIAGLLVIVLASGSTASLSARPQELNDDDRDRYINEIRSYKHEYLTKELDLGKEQAKEFFALYDQMEDRVQQINTETRDLEKQVAANAEASDTELDAASRAVFEQKKKEGEVEVEYYEKFAKVLDSRQMFKLKQAEKRFTQALMRHHRKLIREKKHDKGK